MKILLTRHGETAWNKLNKVQGKVDIPLNEKGIEQANIIKEELSGKNVDLIICSPLLRTRQTVEILNRELNIPVLYDERISERDFGEFEGKKRKDFDFLGFWSFENNLNYERAENIKTFFTRIYDFLDEIEENYMDKTVLIVSHGGVSIPIKCYYNGIPEDDDILSLIIRNCELIEFDGLKKIK